MFSFLCSIRFNNVYLVLKTVIYIIALNNEESIYRTIEQSKTLLKPNKNCIINTDIDGILCGILLQNILNWEIVGFCDSKDSIWINLNLEKEFENIVFVDIYLAKTSFKCIDQHMVAYDLDQVK